MTTTEKIAGAYLRLNGFFLLPAFTTFGGSHHNHVDFLGLRAANSEEKIEKSILPTDDNLFRCFEKGRSESIAIVVEVKTNTAIDTINEKQLEYIKDFFGGMYPTLLAFRDSNDSLTRDGDKITIGNLYALNWILTRVEWMQDNRRGLSKSGSWTWSEEWLADILVLHKMGQLRKHEN